MQNNPLSQYYRQPKVYIDLPSKGKYYPPGCINGDATNLPVFGMTAMDEIVLKTPDALYSGEGTVQTIKSCIPGILDPWKMPSIDLDSVLIAMRIATYGQNMPSVFTCSKCKEENKIDVDLSRSLDYFNGLDYEDKVFAGPLVVNLRPLTYKEQTEIQLQTYQLQRKMAQSLPNMSEVERSKLINEVSREIAEVQVQGFMKCIVSIEADDNVVEDPSIILDFIKNSDREFYNAIKDHLEGLSQKWRIPKQDAACASCGTVNNIALNMDNSDFFGKR